MSAATQTALPDGYTWIEHAGVNFQWRAPNGETGIKNWSREMVMYTAHKHAEESQANNAV